MGQQGIKSSMTWAKTLPSGPQTCKDYLTMPETFMRNGQVISIAEHNQQIKINKK